MELRPIEPIRIFCLDGKERSFLLSMGGFKRLQSYNKQHEGNGHSEIDGLITALWEGLLNKDLENKDALAEVLPCSPTELTAAVIKMMGVSSPSETPTPASEPMQ